MNYTLLIGYTELSWQLLLDILIQHPGKLRVQRNEIRYPYLLAFICLCSCPFPAVIFWSEFSCAFTECFTHVHWRAPAPEGWLLWARPWAAIWSSQERRASDLQLPSACPLEDVTSGLCRHMAAAGTSRFIEGQGMSHQGHNVTRVPTTTQHRVACVERGCAAFAVSGLAASSLIPRALSGSITVLLIKFRGNWVFLLFWWYDNKG